MEMFWSGAVGPLGCNCYIVGDAAASKAIVIDPGGDAADLMAVIEAKGLNVAAIVATHAHFDHVLAAEDLRRATGAPFLLHQEDRPVLDWLQASGRMFLGVELPPPPEVDRSPDEGELLTAGALQLEVMHTPGHSPGSISLVTEGVVFSGDTLFAGSIGRTDLPGGDQDALLRAVRQKMFPLGDEVQVFPGHGPATTLGEERVANPFVGEGSRFWRA